MVYFEGILRRISNTMNEKHTKAFKAAYDYWFEDKPLNEAIQAINEKKKSKEEDEETDKEEHEEHETEAEEKKEKKKGKESKEDKKADKEKKEKKEKGEKEIKEGFDTHVLCNSCGSGNLKLSKKKSKIKCVDCGNTGLTESISGLKLK